MAGPVRIAILANGAQARNEITRTGTTMSKLGGFAKAGIAAAGVGLLALGKSAVTAEAQFSTTMRLIGAATKAPAADMKRLNDLAIKMGADTSFSASEAADAMLELAKAGIDTKTIMGGGLQGTLTLAAAGGTDLGTAATIASNALNTFNLRGKDMAKVAAALAGGANASSASVESLGQALQQVGPGATNAGLSLQETVAALSAFDAAGIKGSDAGTSLKTMLSRLIPQTKKAIDAMDGLGLDFTKKNGSFVSLTDMADQLNKSLGGLSEARRVGELQNIFGSDATRAATVLMKEGEAGIREFIKATNDQSAAQKMANARMGGTAGALDRLSSAADTAKLRLGQELAPAVESTADFLAKKLPGAMEASIDGAKDFGRAVEPLVSVLMDLGGLAADAVGSLGRLPDPIKSVGVQAGVAALALPKLTGAIEAVNGKVGGMVTNFRSAETRTAALGSAAKTAAGIGGILALTSALSNAADDGASFGDVMKGAAGGAGIGAMFGPVGALVGAGVGGGLTALTGAFAETTEEARAARLEMLKTQGFQNAKEDAESLRTSLEGVVNAYGKTARAAVKASFTGDDGQLDADVAHLRGLGVSIDTITSASMGNAAAQRIVNRAFAEGGAQAEANRTKYRRMWSEAQDGMTEWTDYYGNVHVKKMSGEEITELRRKYDYWSDQVKRSTTNAQVFGQRIQKNTGAIAEHGAQMRDLARALNVPLEEYKKFPKAVRTKVEAEGIPQTAADAIRLVREYKGLQNFKRIQSIISAPGVDLTKRQVLDLQKKYDLTPKEVQTLFRIEGIGEALGNLSAGINTAKNNASTGGASIGNALESGIISGFASASSTLATNAASAVTAAVNSARRAADARSPSRKMMSLGKDMADGLAIGMTGGSARSLLSIKSGRSGTATASTSSFPDEVTLLVDGHPMRAIVRREVRRETRYHDRLDDRD